MIFFILFILTREFPMIYEFTLNNKVFATIYASNAYLAKQTLERFPRFRNLSMSEKFKVKINRASK